MAKFKVLISGYREVEIEAKNETDVWDAFWESHAHSESDLLGTEIEEVVPEGKPWEQHTDFN